MPQKLMVRKVKADIVRALKASATTHGRSVEAEHREILRSALTGARRRPLAEALAEMPNAGRDEDFAPSGSVPEAAKAPATGVRQLRTSDIVSLDEASAKLTRLADEVVGGCEKVLTMNDSPYVALIDARRLDYFHELEVEVEQQRVMAQTRADGRKPA